MGLWEAERQKLERKVLKLSWEMRSNLTWWIFCSGILKFPLFGEVLTNDPGIQGVYQKPNSVIFLVQVDFFFIAEVANIRHDFLKVTSEWRNIDSCILFMGGVKVILVGHLARVTGKLQHEPNCVAALPIWGWLWGVIVRRTVQILQNPPGLWLCGICFLWLGKTQIGRTWYFSCSHCRPPESIDSIDRFWKRFSNFLLWFDAFDRSSKRQEEIDFFDPASTLARSSSGKRCVRNMHN